MVKVAFVNCWEVIMEEQRMTNKSSDAGVEYVRLMTESGFIRKNIISDKETTVGYQKLEIEGSPLPEGVYPTSVDGSYEYCTIENAVPDMTSEEIDRLIAMRQAKDIHTIRNWVIFFGVLAVIGLVGGFIVALT